MAERKVLNKYYPPDFDPSLVPRVKRKAGAAQLQESRVMLPMSLQCERCGEYIHKGKKFNATKETVAGEIYLGLQIYRFTFKCTQCLAKLSFKTDPQNQGYTLDKGAKRTMEYYELAKADQKDQDAETKATLERDALAALQHKSNRQKRQADLNDSLQEILELNQSNQRIDIAQIQLSMHNNRSHDQTQEQQAEDQDVEAEIEAEAKRVFESKSNSLGVRSRPATKSSSASVPQQQSASQPIAASPFASDDASAGAGFALPPLQFSSIATPAALESRTHSASAFGTLEKSHKPQANSISPHKSTTKTGCQTAHHHTTVKPSQSHLRTSSSPTSESSLARLNSARANGAQSSGLPKQSGNSTNSVTGSGLIADYASDSD